MNRPPFEVADIIRQHHHRFLEKNRSRLSWLHLRVLSAIQHCRTAALGGHRDRCTDCGLTVAISYNSCRNRHCPKCLTRARNHWLAERCQELLPVGYFHVVFTIPQELSWLALQNKRLVYDLLFRASAATLLEIAADPKYLGAHIGLLSVLHTWGQNLLHHPHIHCVVPAGGFALDYNRWVHPRYPFFLPVKVLSRVFRGKFVAGLQRAFRRGDLLFPGSLGTLAEQKAFRGLLRSLFRNQWVVYAKPPFGGPQHVLHYLARYTHRVAISNYRIVAVTGGQVTFRWKDYVRGCKQRKMTVSGEEFLRRFCLHVLPRGFVRIRFSGFLANRRRKQLLPLARHLLQTSPKPASPAPAVTKPQIPAAWRCPRCRGPMVVIERLTALQIHARGTARRSFVDTS